MEKRPIWSPDGELVAFSKLGKGNFDIFACRVDGTGEEMKLAYSPLSETSPNWSRDGEYLVYHTVGPKNNRDIWYLKLNGEKNPKEFLATHFDEACPQISPDGNYISYISNESGRWEVYVKSFPAGDGKWQVSENGGIHPKWSMGGNEIFNVSGNDLVSVKVEVNPVFKINSLEILFSGW